MIKRISTFMLLALVLSSCGPINTGTVESFPTQSATKLPDPRSISSPTITEQVSKRDIDVPLGLAPTVDGTLSEGEWQGAYEERMLGGGELYFLHDGTYLYLGIDAGARGMGSLCANWLDRVEVLHSSAALGGRYYQRAVEDWSLVEQTDWCCRGGRTGEAAEAEWQAQLDTYGWVSSLYNMGTRTQMEYQIALRDQPMRLAVVFMSMADMIHTWPLELIDDCLDRDLISGETPETLHFELLTWPQLNIK